MFSDPGQPWFAYQPATRTLRATSASLGALLGRPVSRPSGQPLSWLFHHDEHERLDAAEALFGGWSLADTDGQPIPATLVEHTDGEGLRWVAVLPHHAESTLVQRLQRLQASFRDLAENVPGALFRYILHPDGRDRVTYMSSGCRELWEVEPHEIEQDASLLWSMIHPDDRPAMQASVMASGRDLTPWLWEWRITTPSGREKWLQGTGQPSREPSGATVWNSFILDITERRRHEAARRRLERQLDQAQKLEALGRLAGGLAHDFNNMLTVILGAVDTARAATSDPSAVSDALDSIEEAATRSADLTGQLLAFSRERAAPSGPTDLAAHVRRLQPLLERLVGPDVHLEITAADRLPPARIGPTQVDQILTNLAANARDAMPEGGRLTVRLDEGVGATGRVVRLEVRDTGHGMDADTRSRLFEPFFTTKAPGRGTGLGLASVWSILQQIGGSIEVESAPGAGTCFQVDLPVAVPSTARRHARSPDRPLRRILLVDDEPAVRQVVARHLQREGLCVVQASDADEALAHWAEERCDLLITDLGMPGMSGKGLADRLRAEDPDLPVLLISGFVHDPRIREELADEGAPVLHKPFTLGELDEALAGLRSDDAAAG